MPEPLRMRDAPLRVWWVLAVGLAVGLVVVGFGHLVDGGYVMAAALAVAAVVRLLLPTAAAGGLAVRARATDVVVLLILSGALFVILPVLDLGPRR